MDGAIKILERDRDRLLQELEAQKQRCVELAANLDRAVHYRDDLVKQYHEMNLALEILNENN